MEFGILLIDLGLFYGIWKADPREFVNVVTWEGSDWMNNGILGCVVVVRSAFLLEIGGVGKGV